MSKTASILLADDHPMLLKGLLQEFETHDYYNVTTANNGLEALQYIINDQPQVAILDIEMPVLNGFEVIKKAREAGSSAKFVILTYHKEKGFIVQAKKLNIDGYLVKDDIFEEVEKCISAVLGGQEYISSSFTNTEVSQVDKQVQLIQFLTPSERTIIRLIGKGFSSSEIADQLSISVRTVQKHRTNIIAKLDLEPSKDTLSAWAKRYKELVQSL